MCLKQATEGSPQLSPIVFLKHDVSRISLCMCLCACARHKQVTRFVPYLYNMLYMDSFRRVQECCEPLPPGV
jgi:hypothetical protein